VWPPSLADARGERSPADRIRLYRSGGPTWGEVQTPVRCLFLDADDATPLPFQSTFMLPALRRPHPPALRGAAANAGLGGEDLRWLSSVWHAAQRTPAYRAALDAQRQIRGDGQAFRRLSVTRDRTVSTRPQPRAGEILSSFAARSIAHFLCLAGGSPRNRYCYSPGSSSLQPPCPRGARGLARRA